MPQPRLPPSNWHAQANRAVPDIITYRLDESLVYVKPPIDYNEAIDLAIKEYPDELLDLPRHCISFTIQATMNGTRQTVRISESAWKETVHRMVRGEVISIVILPEDRKLAEAPPQYIVEDEASTVSGDSGESMTSAPTPRTPLSMTESSVGHGLDRNRFSSCSCATDVFNPTRRFMSSARRASPGSLRRVSFWPMSR